MFFSIFRYEKEGQPSQLSHVDIFVTIVDPLKESPLVTTNTVLSILAVDYPVDKVSCYVSDDGASMLTFEVLSETSEFGRKRVPFCKKFNVEPRAPEWYFTKDRLFQRSVVTIICEGKESNEGNKASKLIEFYSIIYSSSLGNSNANCNCRESMKSSKFRSMLWLPRLKRLQKKGGLCRMELHGLGIIFVIILE